MEAAICRMRAEHPGWGARRLVFELSRQGWTEPIPAKTTIYQILARNGLVNPRKRRRPASSYKRWQRDAPMQLWQMDIIGGIGLADGSEVKVVTGVDDHARFCVIAKVVPRATGRAVCLALAEALTRFGIPEEVLTDNGKQFTNRFGQGSSEVLFDRICRENGIVHRLTAPASPTTTGKVERFHGSLRRELLDGVVVFDDLAAVQAAIDAWVADYNHHRPHQSLDMNTPASRFTPAAHSRDLPPRLPAGLAANQPKPVPAAPPTPPGAGGPVTFTKVVPTCGNMRIRGKQFAMRGYGGVTVTIWATLHTIQIQAGGKTIRTVSSHLTRNDLGALAQQAGRDNTLITDSNDVGKVIPQQQTRHW